MRPFFRAGRIYKSLGKPKEIISGKVMKVYRGLEFELPLILLRTRNDNFQRHLTRGRLIIYGRTIILLRRIQDGL